MLNSLFRRLTAEPAAGTMLFESATAEARKTHWYSAGAVPDTIDGRFAMLATVLALINVRLERDGADGDRLSAALTERFIAVMESEHRELGLGDPALGRTVRKLVGSLAKRTDLWRSAKIGTDNWRDAAAGSLFKAAPSEEAVDHCTSALAAFAKAIEHQSLDSLAEGKLE
jgi:cytochrome b pre-mRNA-processing protein 3